jgi:steroid delta-isomerase-like uncharacterized protein
MSVKEIKTIVRRFFKERNKGMAALMAVVGEFYAADIVFHKSTGEDIHGIEDYKQFMSVLFNAFPDLHYTIDDLFAERDKVAVRTTFTGTHTGEWRGTPPTNNKITMWEIIIYRFAGGKVVEGWSRSDSLYFMQQLSVVPTQEIGK